ncbi:MAG: hypothetical protein AVDCRST_MAG02-4601, partial [uncultured Rubrobacteraceae bacterium]
DRPRDAPLAGGNHRQPDRYRHLPLLRRVHPDHDVLPQLPRVHVLDQQGRI